MAILVDTSILVRLANRADLFYPVADRAVMKLHNRGEIIHSTPQNNIEFRSVATRPVAANGLGLSPAFAAVLIAGFEATFPLLAETPDIYPAWKTLVQAAGVVGRQVHDARLVAICHVYSITHFLTFNAGHFAQLAGFGPGVAIVDPATV